MEKIIRRNLYVEYNIIKIIVEFYEFYEELANEFNEKESDVKIINCDEKTLNNLRKDWISLNIVRDFVKKSKSKLDFNNENVVNEGNNENNNENVINVEEKKEVENEDVIQL